METPQVDNRSQSDHDLIIKLQTEVDYLKMQNIKLDGQVTFLMSTMRTGKGVLMGILFIAGSLGLAAGDVIKRIVGMHT